MDLSFLQSYLAAIRDWPWAEVKSIAELTLYYLTVVAILGCLLRLNAIGRIQRLAGCPAAIDLEGGAGDEAGVRRGQEQDGFGDLVGIAPTAQRMDAADLLDVLGSWKELSLNGVRIAPGPTALSPSSMAISLVRPTTACLEAMNVAVSIPRLELFRGVDVAKSAKFLEGFQ